MKLPVWPTQPHIEAEPEIFSKPRLRPLIVADANEDFYERFCNVWFQLQVSQIRYLKLPVWPTQPHIETEPEIFSKPRLRPLIVADANEDFYERFVTCGSNYR